VTSIKVIQASEFVHAAPWLLDGEGGSISLD
jgi:hypothetical protein